MSGILVVFILGAGGPLLPHGGKLIVGLMIKYCTNLNFAEYFLELCMPACFQKAKMNALYYQKLSMKNSLWQTHIHFYHVPANLGLFKDTSAEPNVTVKPVLCMCA